MFRNQIVNSKIETNTLNRERNKKTKFIYLTYLNTNYISLIIFKKLLLSNKSEENKIPT